MDFIGHGYTDYGTWTADVIVSDNQWATGSGREYSIFFNRKRKVISTG